ncbi:MAG: hypothetical protein KJ052_16860 [Candidatus Hydrogenedentes bacterium]|nr:hypothetical protein [Candidatus Hydrogenedentota bacterium]
MRLLQLAVLKLLAVGLIAGAVLLALYEFHGVYWLVADNVPDLAILRYAAVVVLLVAGVFALTPLPRPGQNKKTISYAGAHGTTTIQLDSVEASLTKALSKRPEVKKPTVRVTPDKDRGKVSIFASLTLVKGSSQSVPELSGRVRDYLDDAAQRLLGADEVTSVDLEVRRIEPVDDEKGAEKFSHGAFEEPEAPAPVAARNKDVYENNAGRGAMPQDRWAPEEETAPGGTDTDMDYYSIPGSEVPDDDDAESSEPDVEDVESSQAGEDDAEAAQEDSVADGVDGEDKDSDTSESKV